MFLLYVFIICFYYSDKLIFNLFLILTFQKTTTIISSVLNLSLYFHDNQLVTIYSIK